MKNFMKSQITFVATYLPIMVLTYVLPYFGSNSHLPGIQGNRFTVLHYFVLAALVVIAFYRGIAINKKQLWILPFIATIFDMAPELSVIPFVPSLFHLATLGIGLFMIREPQEQKI